MFCLSSPVYAGPTPRTRLRVSAVAAGRPATVYELLSVAETAGAEEIKAAYRRQALRWHPDACRSAGDERRYAERFMRAREAYEVLSDPARRRRYDLALSADRCAAPAFRAGGDGGAGFGDWETQLERLRRRSAPAAGGEETWGGRMRRIRRAEPSL